MFETADKYRMGLICLALTVITLAVFWQVHSFEFTNYDDNLYVTQNNHILTGLKWSNIVWAFTSEQAANWHPLTGLSHMLDCQLFDLRAGSHHVVNLLFHIANTLLLFIVLRRMTGALWASGFAAALFAVHPLHVESVAWISERKDVLSTFLWLLTMAAYLRYVKNPKVSSYILAVVFFAMGLMSKPMLVTLPFVLLLLDYWPLNRFEGKTQFSNLVCEKIPFFILSAASCVVTFLIQRSIGAVGGMELFALRSRIANAVVSYAMYIMKMFWPAHLGAFYPHFRTELPLWQILASGAGLSVVTMLVIHFGAKHRYLPVGWFWYVGTLVPVIGLVQVGSQSMADRYSYVPLTGLFIIIAWGIRDLTSQWQYRKIILGLLSATVILFLGVCAGLQTSYWRNSVSLFEHTLKVTPENQLMDNKLGLALLDQNKYDEAIKLFRRALELKPDYAEAINNLGFAYSRLGRWQEAIEAFTQAVKNNPNFAEPYYNLAVIFCQMGQYREAADACRKAIKINPDYAKAHAELGFAYSNLGLNNEAIAALNRAVDIEPNYAKAYFDLSIVYTRLGRFADAVNSLNKAIENNPRFAEAYYNLSVVEGNLGHYENAIEACRQAIRTNPDYAEAYFNLGAAYFRLGRIGETIDAFKQAVRIKPDFADAHRGLGIAFLKSGDKTGALAEYEVLKKLDAKKADALLELINK